MVRRRSRFSVLLEYAFVAAIVVGLAWTAWYFLEYHYLPQPWFYEPSGTFMDWYSLSLWGQIPGAYDAERTIYPPLSFVVLKIFSVPGCYTKFVSEAVRDCDPVGIVVLSTMVGVNAVLTFAALRKHDRESFAPRAFALSFGFPMLYAYERGNLVLLCYTAMLLGFGPLLRSARLRWLFAAMAPNFKVYLIGAMLAPLLRRRWLQTEGMLFFSTIIYLLSWQILGEGNPLQLYRNIADYLHGFGAGGFLDLWFAGSLIPAISLLKGETFPITTVLDTRTAEILLIALTSYLRVTQVLIVLAAVATWLRPEAVPMHRVVFLATALALSSSEAGGYTEVLPLLFIFMEKWRGFARPLAIVIAYCLCIPADYVIFDLPPVARVSWLGGDVPVIAQYGVGLASFLRPIGIHAITIALAGVTIRDVWSEIRDQGWREALGWRPSAPTSKGAVDQP
jgi:hypothetical protein